MVMRISALILICIGVALATNCPPLTLPNGTVTYDPPNQLGSYSEGTVAYGMCNIDFALFGTSSTWCENGQWKWQFGECKEHRPAIGDPHRCPTMVVPNGNITFSGNLPPYEFEVPEGTTGHLTCTRGFEVVGGSADFTCNNGMWTPMLGSCHLKNCTPPVVTPKTCSAMTAPSGATLTYSNSSSTGPFPQGTLVLTNQKCDEMLQVPQQRHALKEAGTHLSLEHVLQLLQRLQVQLQCFIVVCNCIPGSTPGISRAYQVMTITAKCGVEVTYNGLITYSDGQVLEFMKGTGTTGTLACDFGLVPSGPTSTYCQNGKWTPQLGDCVGQCP
ncbi:sushi domain protein [Ancylostoma duodenale]|uniref:Sushi domain protein n=1 Tax=Ancylostoma duodenale TaxID=51022 RepID=A0A0C2GKK6_9BILA|nr:sushi domain protein [Ancylostoma duodenale]